LSQPPICRALLCLLLAYMLAGCNNRPVDRDPERFGLTETVEGRTVAEEAALFVNLLLPADEPLRLRTTWPAAGYFPVQVFDLDKGRMSFRREFITDTQFDNGVRFINADAIPVYLIDGASLGNIEVAFVPEGCRCIFINSRSIDDLSRRLFLIGQDAFEQHNSFDKALALSLVLLHELGHVKFRDRSSYASVAQLNLAELNQPAELISNPEVRADAFASKVVRMGWASAEMKGPLGSPYGRASIASDVFRVMATGFNSFDLKNDPQGILNHRQNYQVFAQKGYSHLNLYVRLLVFLQQSEPTAERLHYLEKLVGSPAPSRPGQ
jgi:hypothetical protein